MSLKIIVCVKQVPAIYEIKIDKENNTLDIANVKKVINPEDINALEEALKIKDLYKDTHISVVTMGPKEAKDALLECLALGADDGILINEDYLNEFQSDTYITSMVLGTEIKKLGDFDMIFTGSQAIGGDTGHVGPQLAEMLNISQVTNLINLKIEDTMNVIITKRVAENYIETIRVKMPCLVTASRDLNKPRSMSLKGIMAAKKKEIKTIDIKDLDVEMNSKLKNKFPTKIISTHVPTRNIKCKFLHGENEEIAHKLLNELKGRIKIS